MRALLSILIALTLALTACGDDDDATPTPTTTNASRTTTPTSTTGTTPSNTPVPTPCTDFPSRVYRLDLTTGAAPVAPIAHGTNGRWSPNGEFFAYYVFPNPGTCNPGLVIDDAGQNRQFVFSLPVWDWAWSPDSTAIAVASYDNASDTDGLYVIPVPGGDPERIAEGPITSLSWAPDSHSIAYATDASGSVATVDIATGEVTDYPSLLPTGFTGGVVDIAWSSHGDRLAVTTYLNDARGLITDTSVRNLFALTLPDGEALALNFTGSQDTITDVQWSPDGSTLLFETASDNNLGTGAEGLRPVPRLYTVLADNSRPPQEIARGAQPSWSPDGQLIAYIADWCGAFDIAVIGSDGTDNTIVSPGTAAGVQLEPTWSPDGALIAFHSDATYTVTPDGATLTRVGDPMESLAWSPDGRYLTGQEIAGRGLCEG